MLETMFIIVVILLVIMTTAYIMMIAVEQLEFTAKRKKTVSEKFKNFIESFNN